MSYLFYGVIFYAVVVTIAFVFSVRRTLSLIVQHEALGLRVNESLDMLDECYRRISRILELPVGSDDPTIQQLLHDIKTARHALLLIANMIVEFDNMNEDDQE